MDVRDVEARPHSLPTQTFRGYFSATATCARRSASELKSVELGCAARLRSIDRLWSCLAKSVSISTTLGRIWPRRRGVADFDRFWTEVDRNSTKSGRRHRPDLAPKPGHTRPESDRSRCQSRSKSNQFAAKLGIELAKSAPVSTKLGLIWSNFGRDRPKLAPKQRPWIGRIWPTSGSDFDGCRTEFDQGRPELARNRDQVLADVGAEFRATSADFGLGFGRGMDKVGPKLAPKLAPARVSGQALERGDLELRRDSPRVGL